VAGLNSLSDHPAAPDPEARLEHLLVDFADAGHRQYRDEFLCLGAWAEPFRAKEGARHLPTERTGMATLKGFS
jgi:hypothetical protein